MILTRVSVLTTCANIRKRRFACRCHTAFLIVEDGCCRSPYHKLATKRCSMHPLEQTCGRNKKLGYKGCLDFEPRQYSLDNKGVTSYPFEGYIWDYLSSEEKTFLPIPGLQIFSYSSQTGLRVTLNPKPLILSPTKKTLELLCLPGQRMEYARGAVLQSLRVTEARG